MPKSSGTIREAREQFSRLVSAAEAGEPQLVTKRGRAAAVVLSRESYDRLLVESKTPPRTFGEHIISAPKRPPAIPDDEELFPREPFRERELDFE
jgi:prevent-host-death family protein